MRLAVAALVFVLPPWAAAEIQVLRAGELVSVKATAAPLSDVLDRLSRETGMEVVYDGAPPRQRVTLALPAAPHAETVISVLEGHGLNYLARMDPAGTRVDALIIVSGGAGSPSLARGARAPAPVPEDDEPPELENPPEPDPEPAQRPDRSELIRRLQLSRAGQPETAEPDAAEEEPEEAPRPGAPFRPGPIEPLRLPPGAVGPPGTGPPPTLTVPAVGPPGVRPGAPAPAPSPEQ